MELRSENGNIDFLPGGGWAEPPRAAGGFAPGARPPPRVGTLCRFEPGAHTGDPKACSVGAGAPPGGAPALGTGRAAGPAPTARPLNNGRGSGSWGAPPARHLARVPPWPSGDAEDRSASRAAPNAVSPQSRLTLRVTPAAVTAGQLRGRKEMERKGTENWDGKEAAEQEAKRPGKRGAARPGGGRCARVSLLASFLPFFFKYVVC